jgi:hypothetical protein
MNLDQKVPYLAQHNVDSGAFHLELPPPCPTQGFRSSSNSVRDCRLRATDRHTVRVKSPVGISSGYVANNGEPQKDYATMSRNARRRAIRKLRKQVR